MTVSPIAAGFRGAAVPMQPSDITAAAARLGCEEALIRAILDVESSARGFDAAGRPRILFERHILWRMLSSSPYALQAAEKLNLATQHQGTLPYAPNSEGNYLLLKQACAIDPEAALKSASWGLGQVMGFNFKIAGHACVFDMVTACMASEAAQFELVLRYLEANHLVDAMRGRNFLAIARGYNGTGAAAQYAAKLSAAYLHHRQDAPAPAKLVAPALGRPPYTADPLQSREWLRVRAGQMPAPKRHDDVDPVDHARVEALNAAELARHQGEAA